MTIFTYCLYVLFLLSFYPHPVINDRFRLLRPRLPPVHISASSAHTTTTACPHNNATVAQTHKTHSKKHSHKVLDLTRRSRSQQTRLLSASRFTNAQTRKLTATLGQPSALFKIPDMTSIRNIPYPANPRKSCPHPVMRRVMALKGRDLVFQIAARSPVPSQSSRRAEREHHSLSCHGRRVSDIRAPLACQRKIPS